ncbi:MAG: hypothetical protein AAF844_00250 [Pseudomonadota bacterium]
MVELSHRFERPQPDEIEAALGRILSSEQFARSDRLSRFLTHIVKETVAGRDDRLGGYAIGLDVFDRPTDFDPTVDTIVRVEARRLRQALEAYYVRQGTAERVEIVLPKGGYVPVFHDRPDDPVPALAPAKRAQSMRGPVVAVLPVDDYSGGETPHFFANGLTEQIIAALARFRDLSVISRSTVQQFRDTGTTIAALRETLGVDYVFEGSFRMSADRVRVTGQLIDAERDVHLWADVFDRALTARDLFEIQDDLAEILAARIADRYGPIGRRDGRQSRPGTGSLDAYSAVLMFYDNYALHDPELHAQARAALERAVKIDPAYADAWAALGAIHLDEFRFNYNVVEGATPALERTIEAASYALVLDANNIIAHQFLACAYFHAGAFDEFRVFAEKALTLNPGNADVLADMGTCYAFIGEIERGEALTARALELNPTHPGWYHTVGMVTQFMHGDYQAALQEQVMFHTPGFFWSFAWKAPILAKLGRIEEAAEAIEQLLELYPDFAERYRTEARKWQVPDKVVEKVADGLRLGGLSVV